MKPILTVAFALLSTLALAGEQNRLYDSRGNSIGTAATNGNVTTFRDARGNTTGTATRLPDGRTNFRDVRGRLTGTGSGR
jgi:hypothetical protein